MTRRRTGLILATVLPLAALGGGAWWWQQRAATAEFARSCLPTPPALGGADADLRARISQATQRVADGNDPVSALRELANLYQANGHDAEASRCLQALATLEPNEPRWPHRLAVILAGYGRLDDARPWFERTLQSAPKRFITRIRFADTLVKSNRLDEAAAQYTTALEHDADNPYALLGLGRIAIAKGNWAEARRHLETAAGRTQGAVGGDLLATVYEQLGDVARALALRGKQKASGAFSDIPDPWLEELFDDCYDTYRISVASGAAAHRGDTELANRWIERALSLAPTSVPTLFQRGGYRLRASDLAGARRDFQRCTELDPTFSDGWAYLSSVLAQQGLEADSDRVLFEGLRKCPNSPGLHLTQARRLGERGQIDPAIYEYRTVLRLRPEEAEAYVELAGLLFSREKIQEGIDLLLEAQRVEPDNPSVLGVLARSAIMLGDEPGARRWMQRVRQQPRVSSSTRGALEELFRERFGRAP